MNTFFKCHLACRCSYIIQLNSIYFIHGSLYMIWDKSNGRISLLLQCILFLDHLWCISAVNEQYSFVKERPQKNTKLLYADDIMKYYNSLSTSFKTPSRCGMAACREQLTISEMLLYCIVSQQEVNFVMSVHPYIYL
jgi:hypothetical protein